MEEAATPNPRGSSFALPTRVLSGAGLVDRVGAEARALGARRVFVVSDPGVDRAGHVARVGASLGGAQLSWESFVGTHENPTAVDVEHCRAALADCAPELVVAVGGGSSIDTAKGAALLHARGGDIGDHVGYGKATGELLPIIAIPTTAGTGSEVQSYALISDSTDHRKMACGDPQLAPTLAVLDPELTVTQPREVAACTGLDALVHALEAAVTKAGTRFSEALAVEAFCALESHIDEALSASPSISARLAMLEGAALAGMAIELSMLGAAHALANPLTARFGIAHGHAVALMLPRVVRFNVDQRRAGRTYHRLAVAAGLAGSQTSARQAAEAIALRVEGLLERAQLPRSLAELGIESTAIDELSVAAAQQWTAGFNPRAVGPDELGTLYRAALARE